MTNSVRVRRCVGMVLLLATASGSAGEADAPSGNAATPFYDAAYSEYHTHPREAAALGLVAEGVTGTYVAPEVVSPNTAGAAGWPPPPTPYLPATVTPTYLPPESQVPCHEWQLLPGDLLFRSLIAGVHSPRMGGEIVYDRGDGALLEVAIGSRMSVLRKGTTGPHPEGWEIQVYGAALTRLAMERQSDVEATDYKFGVPVVWRRGPTAVSLGYDHLSSHTGDEFLIRNPDFERINYVRDAISLTLMHDVNDELSVYGEANRAFHTSGGAGQWHFQFGAEFLPYVPPGFHGAPVLAVNTLLREEFNYEGSLGVVAGWQWRGLTSDDLLRIGLTTYIGRSRQFSFYDRYEQLFGAGLWYDF